MAQEDTHTTTINTFYLKLKMDKLRQYYHKVKVILFCIPFILLSKQASGQLNCNALYQKGTPEHCACELLFGDHTHINNYYQGTNISLAICDSAIMLFPTFADAYYIKAIPFLKRGEFFTWKKIIDKAVEYDSLSYLGYRGGAQYMFLRNYKEAINDIETLQSIAQWDIGTIYNGEYELEIIRALSYKGLCDTTKAIRILENHINQTNDAGLYGYYHLGVMYFEQYKYEEAMQALLNQISGNEIADAYYYLGLIYEKADNYTAFQNSMKRAYDLYISGRKIRGDNSYMDYPDKIYLKQIEDELTKIKKHQDY